MLESNLICSSSIVFESSTNVFYRFIVHPDYLNSFQYVFRSGDKSDSALIQFQSASLKLANLSIVEKQKDCGKQHAFGINARNAIGNILLIIVQLRLQIMFQLNKAKQCIGEGKGMKALSLKFICNETDWIIINIMLNKYKYSVNRGLKLSSQQQLTKRININTYGIVCQSTPTLYDISINQNANMVILYNDHQYLHRECTYAADSTNQQILNQISRHYISHLNNLTIFVASQPIKSEEMIIGFQNNSLLHQTFANIKEGKQKSSKIGLSIVGVKSENILTDQLDSSHQTDSNIRLETVRPMVRLRNLDSWSQKYGVENLTKRYIEDEKELQQFIIQYKENKNTHEYMSLADKKQDWDWLQAELFIINEYNIDSDGEETVVKCHYLLKVNQYLQTTSSLMLKLGITLRKLQEKTKGAETNQTKLFKLLSNCWMRPKSLHTVHLFVQIGHQLTLKEEYLNLVPTAQLVSDKEDKQLQQLPFFYIKNYQNYPKITSFLSRLNKQNSKVLAVQTSVRNYSSRAMERGKIRCKSYAKDTLSSIQKKRVNNILQEFQDTEEQQNKNLQQIIQEAAKLYKQPNPNFRLSYHKQSNIQALKKHKKFIQTLNATNPNHLFHSERIKNSAQSNPKQTIAKTTNNKWKINEAAFEVYNKNRRTRNFRKQKKTIEEKKQNKQKVEVENGDQIILFDEENDRLF